MPFFLLPSQTPPPPPLNKKNDEDGDGNKVESNKGEKVREREREKKYAPKQNETEIAEEKDWRKKKGGATALLEPAAGLER